MATSKKSIYQKKNKNKKNSDFFIAVSLLFFKSDEVREGGTF